MIILEKNTNRKTKATVNFDFVNLNNTISLCEHFTSNNESNYVHLVTEYYTCTCMINTCMTKISQVFTYNTVKRKRENKA